MSRRTREARSTGHGDVFERGSGMMHIHVHRENGLAHGSLVLKPWQVQALRMVASRWFVIGLTIAGVSWAYFAFQTARVPFLMRRIAHLEQDSAKIDTLQATLSQVQKRYDQVQQMLSASAKDAPATSKTPAPGAPVGKKPTPIAH
jgi:hypothetical protein